MSYQFKDAIKVDANGTIELTVVNVDEDGIAVSSFQYTHFNSDQDVSLEDQVAEWVAQNPDKIATKPEPTIEELRAETTQKILFMLSALVSSVTSKYLPTDPIQWPIKEAESEAWKVAADADRVSFLAPTIWRNFVKAYPDETDTEIKQRVDEEVGKILVRAEQFHDLSAFTEAVREVSHKAIAAAADEAQLFAIYVDAEKKVSAVAASLGG